MIVKIHTSDKNRKILAVCDTELIGKKFTEGNLQLDLSSDFYNGKAKTNSEIIDLFTQVHIINFVGKKSVQLGIDNGFIDETHVISIQEIPHAQVILNE